MVWDLDGTLVDSYEAITSSLNRAREAFSLPRLPEEVVRRHVGRGLEALLADLLGGSRVEEGVRIFREHYPKVFPTQTFLLPGVQETLGELHERGYRMAVASNKPARFGKAILESLGVMRYLDDVQGPDSSGRTKPHPAMIRQCLVAMDLPVRDAIYVGDMSLDVESAARAGLPVLLVTGGSAGAEDLRGTGETVLDSILDLLTLLPARPGVLERDGASGREPTPEGTS